MTEEEARLAIFKLHFEYINHTPEERLELYDEYKRKREEIRNQLFNLILEEKQKELKTK